MKLKKVIINGQEAYIKADENSNDGVIDIDVEGNVIAKDESTNKYLSRLKKKLDKYLGKKLPSDVMDDINEVFEDAKDNIDDLDPEDEDYDEDAKDYYEDAIEDANDIYTDYLDNLDDEDDEKDYDDLDDSNNNDDSNEDDWGNESHKRPHTFSFTFDNSNFEGFKFGGKNKSQLITMLPFMDQEDIHELLEKILNDPETIKGLPIYSLLPFLSTKDCDALFIKILDNHLKVNYVAVAPFVSEKCLSQVVEGYINGSYPEVKFDGLYPFLNSKDVKRLFNYLAGKK